MGSVPGEVTHEDIGWRGCKVTDAETNRFDYTVKLPISGTPDLCFSEAPDKLMKCADDSSSFGNGKREESRMTEDDDLEIWRRKTSLKEQSISSPTHQCRDRREDVQL